MKITKNLLSKSLFTFFIVCSAGLLFTQVVFAATAEVKSVGSVTFVTGDASITHSDKTSTAAVKNAALVAGDTIETKNGRLQLALMDGGKVSLQPNTIYKINKYEFSGKEDGSEYAFTELLKGGMRTISGLIGHKNRDRYQLKTAVATIGIRGTEFTVNFNHNQLLMTTNHGSVDVCNAAGCLNAITGQSIAVSGASGAPKPSSKAAKAAAAAPASSKAVFSAGDTIDINGVSNIVANASSNSNSNSNSNNSNNSNGNQNAIFTQTLASNASFNNGTLSGNVRTDNNGRITTFEERTTQIDYSFNNALGDVYKDGFVTLGLSSGSTNNANVIENLIDFQAVVGRFTSTNNLLNLAALATPVTYNILGSTGATAVSNNSGIVSATTGSSNSVTGSLTVNFNTLVYGYNLNNITVSSNTFSIVGSGLSLVPGSSTFNGAGIVTANNPSTCIASCNGTLSNANLVQGGFFGANAERVGLQYGFTTSNIGNVTGSVVLGR